MNLTSPKSHLTVVLITLAIFSTSISAQSIPTTTISPTANNTTANITETLGQNATSIPTNNTIVNTTTTTTSIPTTTASTTPSPPPTTTEMTPRFVPKTLNNFYCVCDYHLNFCDLNCCCDEDCSTQEKAVFSGCSDSPYASIQQQRSCFKSTYFFRHNLPEVNEEKEKGLFCIAYDNNKDEEELSVPKFLPGKLPKLSIPQYTWLASKKKKEKPSKKSKDAPYKFRSIIQAVKTTEHGEYNSTFDLPTSFHGQGCRVKEPISFLQDRSETCIYYPDLKLDCEIFENFNANTYLKDLSVVANLGEKVTADNLLSLSLLSCDVTHNCGQTLILEEPYLDESSKNCNNVLEILDLTFVHSGVEGIEDVLAKVVLRNYSIGTKEIRQEFRLSFIWTKEENDTDISPDERVTLRKRTEKSGNPGYIVGKPIVMGEKILRDRGDEMRNTNKSRRQDDSKSSNNRKTFVKQEIILLDPNPNNWMTVLGPGDCKTSRKPVLFGKTINTMCRIDVTKYKSCQELQLEIGTILLGVPPANFTNRYVSPFGNYKFEDPKDWVKVLTTESPFGSAQNSFNLVDNGCDGLTASMHVQIAYAYVGSVKYPQAAILGVLYEFGESFYLKNKTMRGERNHVTVSTTVGFADITTSPTTKIAEWPSLSIQLPPDFFYPFSWS